MAPGDVGELVGFAIAAAEQKHQSFVRQLFEVARPALEAVLTVIAVPPVYSIGTTSGGPHAAMPDKVANNSPDNRNATARSRISLTREGNGGKTKDGRNEGASRADLGRR